MTTGERFERLVAIMARLRSEGGCPWDRDQTFDSIKPYTLEETYEVLDAIDARDWAGLSEELGDFLLQAVFYAQMASEEGLFRIDDSLDAINAKLIRRHPHVFDGAEARTAGEVKRRWDEIKAEEKGTARPASRLDTVSRKAPALSEAQQISSKAASAGFDWPNLSGVLEKLHEELDEIERARAAESREQIEDEIGDLLFVVVNLARHLNTDAEQALRRSNAKFRKRFAYVERNAPMPGTPLDEMERLWQEAKRAG